MIFLLLVVYQLKHFLADYPLQGRYMLGKFQPWPKFVLPLLSHGAVHGLFTFFIVLTLKPVKVAMALALFDLTVHSVVDWIKANPSIGGRFTALSKKEMLTEILPVIKKEQEEADFGPASKEYTDALARAKSNTYFWWALGSDQLAHHLTHYIIIWALLL